MLVAMKISLGILAIGLLLSLAIHRPSDLVILAVLVLIVFLTFAIPWMTKKEKKTE